MNPNNNSLARTYFIGGAPRIGKSVLAYALAKRVAGHVVSTDSIRSAAKKASQDKSSDLFIVNKIENVPDAEWLKTRLEHPEKVVESQNRESKAFWSSLVSFCNTFVEDDVIHIVEGVALLPFLVAEMEHKPVHVAYVGNTNRNHVKAMMNYAKQFPQKDWMAAMNYSEEKIEAMASFVSAMSLYFKTEAGKHNFPYYEIDDDNFDKSVEDITDVLMSD